MNYFQESFNKISEDKRNRILETAISEFAEHGFDSANINIIAQKAGISIGSMYKYFGSKENLFLTIVHTGVEKLKAVLDEIMSSEEDFLGKIKKIIRAIQVNSRTNVHLTRLYNEMATESHSELVWKIASDMENVSAGLYASFIKEAQEAGIVREDIDPRYFAFFLDNLFILLQFSYACEYYKERLKIFVGTDVFNNDELVVEEMLKFIKGGFLK
ncbi:MAG: TetR/AcrR family transcriptional regulator [Bacillota bacterium]